MALSEKAREELLAERALKVRERDEANEIINGIDILLRLGSPRVGGNEAAHAKRPAAQAPAAPDVAHLGLREAVRRALASLPNGGRPVEVTAVLKRWKFPEAGSKHRLSLRVSNDLNRMRRTGAAIRDERGIYRISGSGSNGNGQIDVLAARET